jgi:cytidylate kinase
MIITIDGTAGTGKSTVAKKLSELLSIIYFDSGAMYRSITWLYLHGKYDIESDEGVDSLIQAFSLEIKHDNGQKKYFVNDKDVTQDIRSDEVTKHVSHIAAIPKIRHELMPFQRNFARKCSVIFEGRDMGSVVFPCADIKIFLTAQPEVCARRRFNELHEKFHDNTQTYEQVLYAIRQRNERDSNRKVSPLICPDDAICVDTSHMDVEAVVAKLIKIIKKYQSKRYKMKWFYWLSRFVSKVFFKVFYRLKVYGEENFTEGAAIIASNHVSFYDPPLIAAASPEEICFLAKDSLFRAPLLGMIIRKLNALPISRGVSDRKTFKAVLSILKQNKKVLLFPEGERSLDGVLQNMLPGVGFLMYMSKCDIIPIYLHGVLPMWPRSKALPKLFGGKFICVFGKTIFYKNFDKLDKKEAITAASDAMAQELSKLQQWCENGCIGNVP